MNEWLAGEKGVTMGRTGAKYQQIIAEFNQHTGERANNPLAAISPRDVRSFRDALARAGHSPATVNGALKILAALFTAAVRLGYIPVNPVAAVELLRDDADTEKDGFTAEQVRALITTAEGDWKGAILCGCFPGLRLRDVTDLRWEAVDLTTGVFPGRLEKRIMKTTRKTKLTFARLPADFTGLCRVLTRTAPRRMIARRGGNDFWTDRTD